MADELPNIIFATDIGKVKRVVGFGPVFGDDDAYHHPDKTWTWPEFALTGTDIPAWALREFEEAEEQDWQDDQDTRASVLPAGLGGEA